MGMCSSLIVGLVEEVMIDKDGYRIDDQHDQSVISKKSLVIFKIIFNNPKIISDNLKNLVNLLISYT